MLDADFAVHRDDFSSSVALRAEPGSLVAVVGPNGAGKTTVLRALAGLTRLADGFVRVDGVDWERVAAGRRLPPDGRDCALVLADPLLFPHRSVAENVAFGQLARGVPRRAAQAESSQWLDRFGVADLADRSPRTLSTGQQQRVSLARALAVRPALLLLDEPLAAQDPVVRSQLRIELQDVLRDHPGAVLLVTHDPIDALTLADEVVVMEAGEVVQSGPPRQLAAQPRTEFVAQMVGLNLLRGQAAGHRVDLEGGGALQPADECFGPVLVAFAPHAVALSLASEEAGSLRTASSPRNVWSAKVANLQHAQGRVRVRLVGPPDIVAEVTTGAAVELAIRPGQNIVASVKATEIEVYPG